MKSLMMKDRNKKKSQKAKLLLNLLLIGQNLSVPFRPNLEEKNSVSNPILTIQRFKMTLRSSSRVINAT